MGKGCAVFAPRKIVKTSSAREAGPLPLGKVADCIFVPTGGDVRPFGIHHLEVKEASILCG